MSLRLNTPSSFGEIFSLELFFLQSTIVLKTFCTVAAIWSASKILRKTNPFNISYDSINTSLGLSSRVSFQTMNRTHKIHNTSYFREAFLFFVNLEISFLSFPGIKKVLGRLIKGHFYTNCLVITCFQFSEILLTFLYSF